MGKIEKPQCTFGAAFASYLLAQQSRNLTRNYLALLERTRNLFERRFGADVQLEAITADQLRTFLLWLSGQDGTGSAPPTNQRGKPLAGASVSIHYRNLKAFFTWADEEELVRSPMKRVKSPRVEEKLPDALTEAEAHELLEQVRTNGDRHAWRDYGITLMFLDTGIRLQELAAINVDDLNFAEGWAKVFGKGRKERIVPLGVELRAVLSKYLLKHREAFSGEPALFTNEHGLRFDRQGIRTMIVRDLESYVPRKLNHYGPHTLRHTSITFRLRKTRDLKTTSLISGHSTTRTTERYVHLVGADVLRDAAGSAMDDVVRGKR